MLVKGFVRSFDTNTHSDFQLLLYKDWGSWKLKQFHLVRLLPFFYLLLSSTFCKFFQTTLLLMDVVILVFLLGHYLDIPNVQFLPANAEMLLSYGLGHPDNGGWSYLLSLDFYSSTKLFMNVLLNSGISRNR